MITHVMNIRREEQYHTVCAALLHDMGKLKNMRMYISELLIPEKTRSEIVRPRKRLTA